MKVPEITVTSSRLGCQWGAILKPDGIFKRIVYSPELAVGSPSSTANCAADSTTGGAGPHFTWSGVNALCGVPDWATTKTVQKQTPRNNGFFIIPPLLPKTWSPEMPKV